MKKINWDKQIEHIINASYNAPVYYDFKKPELAKKILKDTLKQLLHDYGEWLIDKDIEIEIQYKEDWMNGVNLLKRMQREKNKEVIKP